MQSFEVIIAGAGIVGLTVARELMRRGVRSVLVLDKEGRLGVHASGRNSGVLHAGLYYGSDSLKARVCADGSRRLQAYAAEHGIRVEKTGKVVVARSELELPVLEALSPFPDVTDPFRCPRRQRGPRPRRRTARPRGASSGGGRRDRR